MPDADPAPTPDNATEQAASSAEGPTAAAEAATAPDTPSKPDSGAESEEAAAPRPAKAPDRTPPDGHWWWGLGRRKSAVARVRIRPGTGKFIINKRPYDEFFNEDRDRKDLMTVLEKTSTAGGLDIHVNVRGGGYTGQAGAIILGLGRALLQYDQSLDPILRDNGFLTRDPRKVERKKYGQPGARARFQFSKR